MLRSQKWVESLADSFRKAYQQDESIRVFSKYNKENRKDFGLNELLFDISVCKINYLKSPRNKELAYIERAHWLVESEMAKDTRQLLYDFNKLIIGNAENKLFVGPLSRVIIDFLPELSKVAKYCSGNLYFSLIPHPADWENPGSNPRVWKFDGNEFKDL